MNSGLAPQNPALPTAAIAALHRGNKIEAIKIVREEQHIGLKEAKDIVDEALRAQPALQSAVDAAGAGTGQKLFWWLVIIAGAAFLAYYYLGR